LFVSLVHPASAGLSAYSFIASQGSSLLITDVAQMFCAVVSYEGVRVPLHLPPSKKEKIWKLNIPSCIYGP